MKFKVTSQSEDYGIFEAKDSNEAIDKAIDEYITKSLCLDEDINQVELRLKSELHASYVTKRQLRKNKI